MKLHKSTSNYQVGGVCSGIAETYNIDPTIVRIIFCVLAVLLYKTSAIPFLYFILALIMPED